MTWSYALGKPAAQQCATRMPPLGRRGTGIDLLIIVLLACRPTWSSRLGLAYTKESLKQFRVSEVYNSINQYD